ncbi:hypothetical protein CYMTET_16493 [Cymbomonas tetramitiformis]|uniref:Uncharacterized protein n=1 Tax=Cymbomonas tetramitiformis TaxID=36881 RepID=A0AAE0L889_9CHLO|nr:hypothetical protein CYMTET_16493 [Cymbomonas tetramitiformis]
MQMVHADVLKRLPTKHSDELDAIVDWLTTDHANSNFSNQADHVASKDDNAVLKDPLLVALEDLEQERTKIGSSTFLRP